MMDKKSREKMFGVMMEMCCKGISEEEKAKMKERMESCCKHMTATMLQFKDICKVKPEGFKSCYLEKDFSELMKHCFSGTEKDKIQA
jgi:hypothetical protein